MRNILNYFFFAGFLLAAGCKDTYPITIVEKSVQEICRKEYQLSVHTRMKGCTLFAYVSIDRFLPALTGLDEKTVDILSNVMNSLSRVVLSSDYPFQFIVLQGVDTRGKGAYITLIRHVDDIRRLLTGDISHNEYFDRMVMRTGDDEQLCAEFAAMEQLGKESQSAMVTDRRIAVDRIRSIKKKNGSYLVFVKTIELFEGDKPFFCEGNGCYIFEFNGPTKDHINNMTILFMIKKDGAVLSESIPGRIIKEYGPPDTWVSMLEMNDIAFPDFLAEQISQRIKKTITQDVQWAQKYLAKSVSGSFVPLPSPLPAPHDEKKQTSYTGIRKMLFDNTLYRAVGGFCLRGETFLKRYIPSLDQPRRDAQFGFFEFNVDVQERILFLIQKQIMPHLGAKQTDLLEEIHGKIVSRVLQRYGFTAFREIRLVNTNTGQMLTIPK